MFGEGEYAHDDNDQWIQWEGEPREGSRYPTHDEVVEEIGMTKEEEAAHLEVVRQISEEHGFPIPDWTPTVERDGDE